MPGFSHLKDLIKTLDWSQPLLSEMFEKRKSFAYKYEYAIGILEEARVETLLQKGILRQNGPFLELDETFLDFFEGILEVNEGLNTANIAEGIQTIREQIRFYLTENNDSRRYLYLKAVKSALRKTGRIVLRNIIDLNRNIENTFKAEPTYAVKLLKLQTLDEKRRTIFALLEQTEKLVTDEEKTFFTTATDDELHHLVSALRMQLTEARHNGIETQKQIIEYLNQVKHQNRVGERLKSLKYLKDNFELTHKTDIRSRLADKNALLFEPRTPHSLRLSIYALHTDEGLALIKKVAARMGVKRLAAPVAEAIAHHLLVTETEEEIYINLEELRQGFLASGRHLFDFLMAYRYPREVDFEEKVTLFCQLVGMYETDFAVTDNFGRQNDVEYALVWPV